MSFDHFQDLANRDSFALVTQRESAHLREVLERFHADHAAVALESHDGRLVLLHKSWAFLLGEGGSILVR